MDDLQSRLAAIADNNTDEKIQEQLLFRERQYVTREQKELVAWVKDFILQYAPYNYHITNNGNREFCFELSFYTNEVVVIDSLPSVGTIDFGRDLKRCFNSPAVPKCKIQGGKSFDAKPWIRTTLFKPIFDYEIKYHWFSRSELIIRYPIKERAVDTNRFIYMAESALGKGVSIVSCPPVITYKGFFDNKPEEKILIEATKTIKFNVTF